MIRGALREHMPGIAALCLAAACSGSARSVHPAHVLVVRATDYAFIAPDTVEAGFTAVRLENRGLELHHLQLLRIGLRRASPHEAILFRLRAGKTPADLLEWAGRLKGPPPGELEGGTTSIAVGQFNLMTVDLEAGDYVLLCFVPDAKDRRAHVAHGMVHQLSVG